MDLKFFQVLILSRLPLVQEWATIEFSAHLEVIIIARIGYISL